ncbi:branched-chain amino acid ABC transporter permease [Rhizobium sp. P28RR-XV]|uniref:branched-chain amino acid ABC transporter permease n=1 Tax=Rhizobium sp. P28RR-XV TaxID=2726737 RepID=UPI001456AF6B|nr:branched-chain amino acid ABC transporter permease [Rhizobium sp. P28RR-XV]NLR88194.1 branched-chain amino acid ABC transporter permease [Rhizobium sp. P28RR-XV]
MSTTDLPVKPVDRKAGTMSIRAVQWAPIVILLLALAVVPPLALAMDEPFAIRILTRIAIFAIVAVSLNIVLGYGGLVSLMHASLFGVGGYVVAILAYHEMEGDLLFGLFQGTSDLAISIPVAVAVVALVSAVLGAVSLRTSGSYFIMITLAFNQMLYFFFVALQQYGGDDGLQILSSMHFVSLEIGGRVLFFYICLAILAVVLVLAAVLAESRFGMLLRAMAQNERRVVALGASPLRYKVVAFMLSGAITGLAGTLWATSQNFISPADMSWVRSADFVVMIVLGGMTTAWGALAGAVMFLLLEAVLSAWTTYWQLVFGILIIGSAMTLRGGLSDLWPALLGRTKFNRERH